MTGPTEFGLRAAIISEELAAMVENKQPVYKENLKKRSDLLEAAIEYLELLQQKIPDGKTQLLPSCKSTSFYIEQVHREMVHDRNWVQNIWKAPPNWYE